MLVDSNIIIYATQPSYDTLRALIVRVAPVVSAVSYVEVLGYHRLTPAEQNLLEAFFAATDILSIDDAVIQTAIALRQQKRILLGDALIAATALTHDLPLITRNTRDFDWIENLVLLNPFTNGSL